MKVGAGAAIVIIACFINLPAAAQMVDCEKLKKDRIPFQLTRHYSLGKGDTRKENDRVIQVYPNDDGLSMSSAVFDDDKIESISSFGISISTNTIRSAGNNITFTYSYDEDISKDLLGKGSNFVLHQHLNVKRISYGTPTDHRSDSTMSFAFAGFDNALVFPCQFRVMKYNITTIVESSASQSAIIYSPDLKIYLSISTRNRQNDADSFESAPSFEYKATRIETVFGQRP